METCVLLSIKPQFAESIFQGCKRYEFRRKIFKAPNIRKVVVYASSPVSRVIGEFEIETILELDRERLWEQTKAHSGIEKEYSDKYFDGQSSGFAIKIGEAKRYTNPLNLNEDFNIMHAPQSFIYLKLAIKTPGIA